MKKEYFRAILTGVVAGLMAAQSGAVEQATTPKESGQYQSEPVVVEEVAPAPMPETKPQPTSPQTALATPEVLKLYNHSPEELIERPVIGLEGEPLGKIDNIVSGRASGRVYAVLTRGGFLGIGSSEYAVQLDELTLENDALHMAITSGELEMRREYVKERYIPVEPTDHPISEFSAFEVRPQ
ncbi:hypothetical protein ADIMK_2551 [Marinobacterium lacunae]|uniref:PRC-barrel domain-containing protein n=1 Tax=Marinobacterium lacunae TaxID=1232683 RepID=A0A081FWX2_9GAMM|nr:PRC-barrel domain-containing protein [Marinobacterium lacunae]KEA63027.1 hypothetical protein ADIMK_2551 [Marinobacterium lacunae]